ncbi:DUF3043 domain-containing protein [Brachybacterium huguangmaarense]
MSPLRRTKTETPVEPEVPVRPGAKGRPTRSRREAEAARKRPLVPADRKEARRQDRQRASAERARTQSALMSGDEANMPAQHRGPERRFVRDLVDARHNVAEYFFPVALVVMLVLLLLPFVAPQFDPVVLSTVMMVVIWGGIALCVLDGFLIRRAIRSGLTERFGFPVPGLTSYGIMRAMQIRRFRLPKPQVKHGETPRR